MTKSNEKYIKNMLANDKIKVKIEEICKDFNYEVLYTGENVVEIFGDFGKVSMYFPNHKSCLKALEGLVK